MKKVCLIFVFVISLSCYGQEVKLPLNGSGNVEYSEIVNVDSVDAGKLFSRAKLFITYAFKSGKDVTQLVDEATNTIVGKGGTSVIVAKMLGMEFPGFVKFTISISSKDGKYKYSFTNFVLDYQGNDKMQHINWSLDKEDNPKTVNKKQWQSVKEQTNATILLLIRDLKNKMLLESEW